MSRKKQQSGPWQMRIVGHDRVAPDQLLANPFNHRRHPQKQRDAVAASIRELGFIRSVTVNKRTGHIVDGHERVWQALQAEQPLIDVEYVDLSEEQEKLALAVLDKTTEMAEVDSEALDALLREIETGEAELQALLASMAEDAGIMPPDDGDGDGGSQDVPEAFQILVECDGEDQQVKLLERFQKEGIKCRSLIA
jgi:ParB-like chromosome segregation protein Spo0J